MTTQIEGSCSISLSEAFVKSQRLKVSISLLLGSRCNQVVLVRMVFKIYLVETSEDLFLICVGSLHGWGQV